jgi:hypothetical protein
MPPIYANRTTPSKGKIPEKYSKKNTPTGLDRGSPFGVYYSCHQ